jgi:hypothetical protein
VKKQRAIAFMVCCVQEVDTMNQSERKILIQRAVKLVRLGKKLEMERKTLRELVKQGYSYDSMQVKETLRSFLSLQQEWKELESEHLKAVNALQNT